MAEYQVFLSILPSLIFSPKAYSEGFFSALSNSRGICLCNCLTFNCVHFSAP